MKLNNTQKQILELTSLLEQKTNEYKDACNELEAIKNTTSDPNSELLIPLQEKFSKLLEEITSITQELENIKNKI